MPGPHILGLDFVAFSMISATVQQSWRTWSSLIAFRKSAAETFVSFVLISAMACSNWARLEVGCRRKCWCRRVVSLSRASAEGNRHAFAHARVAFLPFRQFFLLFVTPTLDLLLSL